MKVRTALFRVGLVGGVTVGRLVGTVAMFAMIARAAGPAPFAALTYWYAISVMAAAVTEYGFAQHLLSSLPGASGDRRKAIIDETLGAKYWLAVSAAVVTIACAWSMCPTSDEAWMATVLVVGAMIGSIGELNSMILRALNGFAADSWTSLLSGLVASLAAGVVGLYGDHLVAVALTLLGVRVLGVLSQRWAIRRLCGVSIPLFPRPRNAAAAVAGLKASASNGADNMAIQLLLNFDVIACRLLLDPIQAGLYLSANRLTNAANAGFPVLTSVFLPAIAAGPQSAAGRRATHLLGLSAIIVAIGWNAMMWTMHEPIARLLFGDQFASAGAFLGPLALAVGVRYLSLAAAVKLIVLRRQVWKASATALAIAVGAVMLCAECVSSPVFDARGLVQSVITVYALQSVAHVLLARWFARETTRGATRIPA